MIPVQCSVTTVSFLCAYEMQVWDPSLVFTKPRRSHFKHTMQLSKKVQLHCRAFTYSHWVNFFLQLWYLTCGYRFGYDIAKASVSIGPDFKAIQKVGRRVCPIAPGIGLLKEPQWPKSHPASLPEVVMEANSWQLGQGPFQLPPLSPPVIYPDVSIQSCATLLAQLTSFTQFLMPQYSASSWPIPTTYTCPPSPQASILNHPEHLIFQ